MERPKKLFAVAAGIAAVALGLAFISPKPAGAQSSGGPSVTIANQPVRTVDNEFQGVQAQGSCSMTGIATGCGAELFTVPEGKQLVVEYFSALANVSAVGATVRAHITAGSVFHYLPLFPPAVQGPNQGGITSGGGPVRLYFAAGQIVRGDALRSGNAGNTSVLFSMSGHLIDVVP